MSLVQLGIHFSFLAMELDWHIENGNSALLTTILNWFVSESMKIKIIKNKLNKTDLQFFIPSLSVRLEPVNASISWDQEQVIWKETLFTKAVITDTVLNNDEQMQMSELSLGKVFSVCLFAYVVVWYPLPYWFLSGDT